MKIKFKLLRNKRTQSSRIIFLLLIMILSVPFSMIAQEKEPLFIEMELKDGSMVYGEVILKTEDKVILKTANEDKVSILRSDVRRYHRISRVKYLRKSKSKRKAGEEYNNSTRNGFGQSGYGLRKGEGYFHSTLIILNHVGIGFSDNFSVNAGFELFSLFEGSFNQPGFSIFPKFSFPIKANKWNIGIGPFFLSTGGGSYIRGIYSVNTWGSRENNFSLGLGINTTKESSAAFPFVSVSANLRFGPHFGMFTENIFSLSDDDPNTFFTLGGRYIGKKFVWNFTWYGFLERSSRNFFTTPLCSVGFIVPIGKKK